MIHKACMPVYMNSGKIVAGGRDGWRIEGYRMLYYDTIISNTCHFFRSFVISIKQFAKSKSFEIEVNQN